MARLVSTATKAMAVVVLAAASAALAAHDYGDALHKSILFFEGQRSGRLPPNQRLRWRQDSAIHDGAEAGVRTGVCLSLSFSNPSHSCAHHPRMRTHERIASVMNTHACSAVHCRWT
jgi:hypothetical protein